MKRVEASILVPGPVDAVAALWVDASRWPSWIDGFGRVADLGERWPEPGAVVEWDSRPGGRGRVRERAVAPAEGAFLSLDVEDETLSGVQSVHLDSEDSGAAVRVRLVLDYDLKETNPFTPLVDFLYIRRALRASQQRSLGRFAQERIADAELG